MTFIGCVTSKCPCSNSANAEELVFSNEAQSLSATLDKEQATVNLINDQKQVTNYGVFKRVPSASGEKFENKQLTFWTKGTNATLYMNDHKIFEGSQQKASSIKGTYHLIRVDHPKLMPIIPRKKGDFVITFNEDLSISGHTDCNNFFGKYTLNGKDIAIQVGGVTRKLCIKSQESQFFSALSKVTMVNFSNQEMILTGEDVEIRFSM